MRCSDIVICWTSFTNFHANNHNSNLRHFDQIAETQTISSFRNSLNTSNNFRLVLHSVNTLIHINPQWRLRNNDIHYLLMYYTSLCKIFNILLYTLSYHVEKLHIIMYNIQQYNVCSPVSQNAEFKSFRPTNNMIYMCQKIKYLKTTCFIKMKLLHALNYLNGSVIQKWCHY